MCDAKHLPSCRTLDMARAVLFACVASASAQQDLPLHPSRSAKDSHATPALLKGPALSEHGCVAQPATQAPHSGTLHGCLPAASCLRRLSHQAARSLVFLPLPSNREPCCPAPRPVSDVWYCCAQEQGALHPAALYPGSPPAASQASSQQSAMPAQPMQPATAVPSPAAALQPQQHQTGTSLQHLPSGLQVRPAASRPAEQQPAPAVAAQLAGAPPAGSTGAMAGPVGPAGPALSAPDAQTPVATGQVRAVAAALHTCKHLDC